MNAENGESDFVSDIAINKLKEEARLLEPVNFLIVEDNPDHAEITKRVVKKSGFSKRIDIVTNGAEALEYLSNSGKYEDKAKFPQPDIILTDIDMPVMDGFQVVEKIKSDKKYEHIPVLSVSSHFDNESRLRMLRLGAVDSIVKPFNPEELQARIGTHIKLKQINERMVRAEKNYVASLVSQGISHEIRNRFNSIKLAVYMMKERLDLDGDAKDYISGIEGEIDRGTKLVDELLKFSNPRLPYFEKLDLHDVIDYVVRMLNANERENIKLSVAEIPQGFPCILGDSSQVVQIFSNIILNALEAMKNGGELSIAVENNDEDSVINVHISDTGDGIAEDVIDKVFDPFFTTKEMNSGLGLSVCVSLVKAHGGDILIESEQRKGSRITVQFPVYVGGAEG